MLKPFNQLGPFQNIVRQFTPNWFTVCMGTGIVALMISELPFLQSYLWQFGAVLWQLNTLLFLFFSSLYLARWIIFPNEAKLIFKHPIMCMFLGAIPMALATVINGLLKYGVPLYGNWLVAVAEWLWYLDVVLAVLIAWLVPFVMFKYQGHELKTMTAVWLLPLVACEVAASSGGLLLAHIAEPQIALKILLGSYVLWGISVLPAFGILTVLMLRLALHQLPPKELGMSSWLALGPIGTGALALLILGEQAPRVMAYIDLANVGVFMQIAGLFASLILLGFGLWWLGIALLTTLHHLVKGMPFNLGWWAMTFPLGVYGLAIMQLAHQLQLEFIFSIAYALIVILFGLWSFVMLKTMQGFYHGHLFNSPCLALLQQHKQVKVYE